MRKASRAVVLAFLAFLSSVLVGVAAVLTAAVTLAATTALIVPGTGTPKAEDVADYMPNAYDRFVASSNPTVLPSECTAATECTLTGVDYPASFWPLFFIPRWCVAGRCEKWNESVGQGVAQLAFDLGTAVGTSNKVVLFGYSQGARVVSIEKENLRNFPNKDQLEIVLIGNISRPNGGLWSRLSFLPTIPISDVSFGKPTPTDVGIKTTDISFEYDGVSDFPVYPLNLLADLNALAGFQYVHGYYLVPNGNGPTDQLPWGYTADEIEALIEDPNNPTKGDTTYVTIPAKSLPILQPFIDFGNATGTSAIVNPILELVQPALKVLIDTGYDRTANPGDPMIFRLIPRINPIKLVVDLVAAVGQGIKDAFDGVPIVPTVTPAPTSSSTTTSTFAIQRSTLAAEAPKPQPQANDTGDAPTFDVVRTSETQPDATKPGDSQNAVNAADQSPFNITPGKSSVSAGQTTSSGSTNVTPLKLPKLPKLPKPDNPLLARVVDLFGKPRGAQNSQTSPTGTGVQTDPGAGTQQDTPSSGDGQQAAA